MKIVPTANIGIKGVHAPAGVPIEVDDVTARLLISDGQAIAPGEIASSETAEPSPVESAAEVPVVETAAKKHAVKPKRA